MVFGVLLLLAALWACQESRSQEPIAAASADQTYEPVPKVGLENYVPQPMAPVYQELAEYLRGKDVAMVGPAPNLVGTGLGPEIDSFDVVCRVNNSFIINDEMITDYGSRKDILFNSGSDLGLAILQAVWPQWQSAQYIMLPGIHQHFTADHDTVLEGIKEKKWNFLNTCLSSIRLLLEFEINSLTIYGFTFYKGGKGYVKHQDETIKKIAEESPLNGMHYEPTGKSHQQHKQKKFFRQHIENDPRIIFVE